MDVFGALGRGEELPLASTDQIKDRDDQRREIQSQSELKMMYECAGLALDHWFGNDGGGADGCRFSWNDGSTMLSVEAGAHKFAAFRVYRKTADGFSEVPFPGNEGERLITFVKAGTQPIRDMGVKQLQKKKPLLEDGNWVHFLEDGYVAVNTYGAMCRPEFQALPDDLQRKALDGGDLFFLFQVGGKGPAKFVGFCR